MGLEGMAVGQTVRRADVVTRYGGSIYSGGIVPSNSTSTVMVYTDPDVGKTHGYNFDGWADGAFYYTGEGQVGDQTLTAGNKAIANHAEDGRALHVFEVEPGQALKPKGGKLQRYVGEFVLDPEAPHRFEEATDKNGDWRTVVVFKLLPVGAAVDTLDRGPVAVPPDKPKVTRRAVEANEVGTFQRRGTESVAAQRREADLMARLEAHLSKEGREVCRYSIDVPDSAAQMWTDTFDESGGVLYEVKAAATRENLRMAIGQLADYARFVPEVRERGIVLPTQPSADLMALAHSVGVGVSWPEGKTFRFARPGEDH